MDWYRFRAYPAPVSESDEERVIYRTRLAGDVPEELKHLPNMYLLRWQVDVLESHDTKSGAGDPDGKRISADKLSQKLILRSMR